MRRFKNIVGGSSSTYKFVDLGLPSGTKWATTNLGANSPEEYGLYFAWGETQGYTAEDVAAGKKIFSDGDNYKFGPMDHLSRYNSVDGLTTLWLVDDAAYYMSDGLCKIPSEENWKELIANTTTNTDILNGVNGIRFTSTTNGNSIFIPFSGQIIETYLDGVNEVSLLHTSDISHMLPENNENSLTGIAVAPEGSPMINPFPRVVGMSIRPIKNVSEDKLIIDTTGKTDGVYAISSTGSLIDYNSADETALGVALIAGEHKYMIAKINGNRNGYSYWGASNTDTNIQNFESVGGGHSDWENYLPELSSDYTTWSDGALSDFNGFENTEVLKTFYDPNGYEIGTLINIFNSTSELNQGFSDWYIPACGQLAIIYLNKSNIDAALSKIGGETFGDNFFWSSSETDSNYAWHIGFAAGIVQNVNKNEWHTNGQVRFIRDI